MTTATVSSSPDARTRAAVPEKAKDEYDVIQMSEVKCVPSGFTKWDRTTVDKGDLTLGDFLKMFKEVTGEHSRENTRCGDC